VKIAVVVKFELFSYCSLCPIPVLISCNVDLGDGNHPVSMKLISIVLMVEHKSEISKALPLYPVRLFDMCFKPNLNTLCSNEEHKYKQKWCQNQYAEVMFTKIPNFIPDTGNAHVRPRTPHL
jgi:hypothetical protein